MFRRYELQHVLAENDADLDGYEKKLEETARAMQAALSELELVLADLVVRDGVIAATIRQRGRHTGVLAGPLGELAPTGKTFDVLSIDVLHVRDDRITAVWVVADELGRLLQLGALGPTGMNEATKVPSGIEPE